MKKYIKKLTAAAALVTLVLATAACTGNYENWNTDPNKTVPNVSHAFRLVAMQTNTIILGGNSNPYQRSQNLMGDSYVGYVGCTGVFPQGDNNGTTYVLIDDWNEVLFKHFYKDVMASWFKLREYEEEGEIDEPEIFAVAQILKVAAAHRVTDMYGPIPYSAYGNSGFQAKFDSQEEIYKSFFEDLTGAVATLVECIDKYYEVSEEIKEYDLIYNGDLKKWVVFANSLRLRLANRISGVDPVTAKKEAEAAFKHEYGVMVSNDQNAMLDPQPLYPHPLPVIINNYNDSRMGAMMESYLTGYNDPRLGVYFQPASYKGDDARTYMGVRNGISIDTEKRNGYMEFSKPNFTEQSKVQWMCAAEMYFIRAEAASKHRWDMGGDPYELYIEGIRTSMDQRGIDAAAVARYLTVTDGPARYTDPVNGNNNDGIDKFIAGVPGVYVSPYDVGTDKFLECVGIQKWIALFPEGQEAWSEFRRTGYPRVFDNVVNNSGGEIDTKIQIRRIKYPLSEYNNNEAELKKALNNPQMLNGPDTGGTALWWDTRNQ